MIRVSEIFGPTVQGEGPQIGCPTYFIRTGGCDYRCSWCDTPYAVFSDYRDLLASVEVAIFRSYANNLSASRRYKRDTGQGFESA